MGFVIGYLAGLATALTFIGLYLLYLALVTDDL